VAGPGVFFQKMLAVTMTVAAQRRSILLIERIKTDHDLGEIMGNNRVGFYFINVQPELSNY
jgi:hypothetical protein